MEYYKNVKRIIASKVINVADINKYYFDQKLSAKEVGKKFNLSEWQIYKFMKKHHLSRRKNYESRKYQLEASPKSYTKLKILNQNQEKLFIAGAILYWAEGKKRGNGTVDFTNSNPKIVSIFLNNLRKIYNISEHKLKFSIYYFSDQNYEDIETFWCKTLDVNSYQFTKPFMKLANNPKKYGYLPHGVIHLRYNDTRLLNEIKSDIDIISSHL